MGEPGGPGAGLRSAAAVLLAGLLAATPGCHSPRSGPELLKRHDGYRTADTTGLVDVSVFTVPTPSAAEAPLLNGLGPSAQAAYIRSLADRTSTLEELQAALAAPVGTPGPDTEVVDRTRFRRRLVISVERRGPEGGAPGSLAPGARIAWLRIGIGVNTTAARFSNWNRFATRYDTVELGTMELSRSIGSEAELGLPPDPLAEVLGSAGLEIGRSVGVDESLPLRERYVSNGVLRPDSMILLQEGAVGIDLVGNSVVEVEVELVDGRTSTSTVHRFEGLFDAAGRPRSPDSLRVVSRRLVSPDSAAPVEATIRFESLVRAVERGEGDDSYSEGDDRVRFLRSREEAGSIILVPSEETRVSAWAIVSPDCRILQTDRPDPDPGAVPTALRFLTADDARRFLRWLRELHRDSPHAGSAPASVPTAAGRGLYLGPGLPLTRSRVPELFVRLQPLNWSAGRGAPCS